MIILDTNIISEMMKKSPALKVRAWLDEQDSMDLFITSITIAEISYGINALHSGARKQDLQTAFLRVIKFAFKHRIIDFDELAAYECGEIMSHKKKLGHTMNFPDGQIAGIASVQKGILATRNVKDFKDCGIELVNPFS